MPFRGDTSRGSRMIRYLTFDMHILYDNIQKHYVFKAEHDPGAVYGRVMLGCDIVQA